MNTLTKCVSDKAHTPNVLAISAVTTQPDFVDEYTFCEVCENDIERMRYFDDDRGWVILKWELTK